MTGSTANRRLRLAVAVVFAYLEVLSGLVETAVRIASVLSFGAHLQGHFPAQSRVMRLISEPRFVCIVDSRDDVRSDKASADDRRNTTSNT